MSFRVVRASKYRHVFGTDTKKENCYDGIKISRNAWDSPLSSVNSKFLAIVLEAQGGGSFLVLNLENTGRVDLNAPKVVGHQSGVLDLQFCPYNEYLIASCDEGGVVKVFEIPEGGLKENLTESLVDLTGHQRRVGIVEWHPTAENILMSAGFDYSIFIWDLGTGSAINQIDCHPDTIYCCVWNLDGSKIATTCKDKKIRLIDPRTGAVEAETQGHDGSKASRVKVINKDNLLFTTGFSRMSERQYAVWDPKNMGKPLKLEMIDTGSGVLFIHHDEDTGMVYLAGKGDGNIRYFEVEGKAPWVHSLSEYKSSVPQRGVCFLPKTALNVAGCEVARVFKLLPKGFVQVISFVVPRKSTLFQDDIFPDTRDLKPTISSADWAAGGNGTIKKISMKPFFDKSSGGSSSTAATTAVKKSGIKSTLGSSAAAPKPAAGGGAGAPPTDVAGLTAAWHAHTKEIADLKAKLAALGH